MAGWVVGQELQAKGGLGWLLAALHGIVQGAVDDARLGTFGVSDLAGLVNLLSGEPSCSVVAWKVSARHAMNDRIALVDELKQGFDRL